MVRPAVFFFGMIIPLAAVALVVYGLWELSRSRTGHLSPAGNSGGGAPTGTARLILDERFARGELDAEEYVQRRALLDGTVPSPPNAMVGAPVQFDEGPHFTDDEAEPWVTDPDDED